MDDLDNRIVTAMCHSFRGDYEVERSPTTPTGRGTTEEDRRRIRGLMEGIYKDAIIQHIRKNDR